MAKRIFNVWRGDTKGGDFKPAARPPVETIVHWNGW